MESKINIFGTILPVAGILTVAVCLSLQYTVIDHGSSGQLVVDQNMNNIIWPFLTGFIIMFVGLLIYKNANSSSRLYVYLFAFAWLSYLLSNIAIMLSLYQVQLTK